MALGQQQQQQELSICHRDVKHKFFVFLLKGEEVFFICLSVCPSVVAQQGGALAPAESLWELWELCPGLGPSGSHPWPAASAAGGPPALLSL